MERELDLDMDNKIIELDSKSELNEKFRSLETPKLFIENKEQTPNHFLLIESNSLTVGLATCHQGIKVQVGLIEATGSIVIGHEKELVCCSPVGPAISWRFGLDFCFYEFRIFEEIKMIVVIDEISVVVVNFSGERIWYYSSPDVIEWFNISSSEIKIRTLDNQELALDTKTGLNLNNRKLG